MPREHVPTNAKRTQRATRELRAAYQAVSARAEFKRVTRKQIADVTRKIVEALHPDQVILFGSYACGKPNIDSDVDVLVIMASDERPALRATRAYHAVHGKTFPMDILVRTPQELAHRLAIGDFFIKEIIERGKVLYAK